MAPPPENRERNCFPFAFPKVLFAFWKVLFAFWKVPFAFWKVPFAFWKVLNKPFSISRLLFGRSRSLFGRDLPKSDRHLPKNERDLLKSKRKAISFTIFTGVGSQIEIFTLNIRGSNLSFQIGLYLKCRVPLNCKKSCQCSNARYHLLSFPIFFSSFSFVNQNPKYL